MMKYIHTIVLLIMLLPLGSMAQSLEIVEEFQENKMSTVLTTYKNEFGHREKQHVLDNKFPFAVLEVYLEGDEQAVKAAKSKLSLDLGSHFTVEGVCKTYTNRIVFLISSSVRNVYMTCGDGCKEQVIFSGQTLEQNKIYSGKVKYTPGKETPTPTPNPKKQIFRFEVNPKNASVEVLVGEKSEYCNIDDDIQSITLNHGTYQYKVSAPRYQTETGIIQVSDSTRTKSVQLLPDYGWLTLSATESNSGASAYVINTQTKERIALGNIPLVSYELDRGEYTLQIFQNKYKDYSKKITILPNQTITESPILEPNFISLILSTDSASEIFVNGESFGKGQWSGTLELGEYAVETRKANHRSSYIPLTLTNAEATQTIILAEPTPIYGSLTISGSPAKAAIYVDDKYVGESPLIVNDLLIGEHEVKVEKDGCSVWKKTVTVAENEECIAKYELEKGVSLERIVLKGMNATNLSVKRAGDETLLFTYDLPKKGPVRLRMSTDGYTYVDQKNVKGAVGKEMDKGKQYQITWTIPKDLGRTMQDSLYFQIVALPEFPKGEIKIGSLYYQAVDDGTSVEVDARLNRNKKVTIPAEINYQGYKYSVTSIGEEAFDYCYKLTSITIPNSVTSIGNNAFRGCNNLRSITIPNSVTKIGAAAFRGCKNLKSITIPNSVTKIGDAAFEDCKNLTSITIPNSVTSIGSSVFHGCENLRSINIPNSVTSIGSSVFHGCENLRSITIPNSVTKIGDAAFEDCKNLTSITIPNSVTSIGYWAFEDCKNLTSITIPNSVTSIGSSAFNGCKNLTSINIPNSVTSIGEGAFRNCDNLTSITIPNSVTSIGEGAFEWCDRLTSISVDKNNPKYDSRNDCNAIIETKTNTLIAVCKNTVIPNSVTSIGNNAFESCWYLTSINIPNSVTSIGNHAFYDCSNLTSINIPNSVTSIGNGAFRYCSNLTSITIPNSVMSIGKSAFYCCFDLTSISIPNSVTSIGEDAFRGCDNLISISIPNSVTMIGASAFSACDRLTSISVDKNNPKYDSRNDCNAIIETKTNTLIAGCKNTVIPNSVTSIGEKAFSGCDNLTSITIPNSVTSIGYGAFSGCENLTSISIPNSVTSIGDWAFSYCYDLTSITIPNGVTSIGEKAFQDCKNLTSITMPNSITSIGKDAFYACYNLQTIYIPRGTKAKFAAMVGLKDHVDKLVEQ